MKHFLIINLIFVSFFACKTNKATTKESDTKKDSSIFSIVISFYSIGMGIDNTNHKRFKNYLAEFQDKNNVKIEYIKTPWGREGEVDYCIQLENLSTDIKEKFIDGINNIIKDSKWTSLKKNAKCVHKNWGKN